MSLIEQWLAARAATERAQLIEKGTLGAALLQRPPAKKNLRPATAADIVEGAIIWYMVDVPYWKHIEYVSYPSDLYKGFTAEDGCRYGLEDAYVEIKK